jgi:hypothetical protein
MMNTKSINYITRNKRWLAILLAAVMLFGLMLPQFAMADTELGNNAMGGGAL